MAKSIGDYALIGNCETAALVARDGSIDWLCWPRFDSPACFAALLGTRRNGYWRISPVEPAEVHRRYLSHTVVLETVFSTAQGRVRVIDFMPGVGRERRVTRIIPGERGIVRMHMEVCLRFDYGRVRAFLKGGGRTITAVAGTNRIRIRSSFPALNKTSGDIATSFSVKRGQIITFELEPASPRQPRELRNSPVAALGKTKRFWRHWASQLRYSGPRADVVERSLLTLKALTYKPTGGIVAAPTTSLPEACHTSRNWDYRYCWLRDATFTLLGLVHAGYHREARSWKDWLMRTIGSSPDRLQIMYDVTGKRIQPERKIRWLRGYRGSKPVRVGNAASGQRQLDVFGEVSDTLYQAGTLDKKSGPPFQLLVALLKHLESVWRRPDHGIWETRNTKRQFTHSKVMCWVAFDRAIRAAEAINFQEPLGKWRAVRKEIHETVCRDGFNSRLGSFVQSFGSNKVDASLLLLPLVGFLPPRDTRIVGTIRRIAKSLVRGAFVKRSPDIKEGAFLPCGFWLADYYKLAGRKSDAMRLLDRLLALRNDVGLLSEEYDPRRKVLMGNFPQALSHVALVNTVINMYGTIGPARQRSRRNRPRAFL